MYDYLRIIFVGTPDFSARHLNALIHTKHQLVGVFTQLNLFSRRGNRLIPSPVKQLADQHNLPVFQSISLCKPEGQRLVAALKADIMVVVACGLILPQEILNLPLFGCINVHGSLLPRWRGAAPIQRALLAGDDITGITIIQMDAGLDTGAILYKTSCAIEHNDTSASLSNKLAKIGADSLLSILKQIAAGHVTIKAQDNTLATYADKISKKEAKLDWFLPAAQLELCIRAFNPWPASYFLLSNQFIKVWAANADDKKTTSYVPGTIIAADKVGIHIATSNGTLNITQLQMSGKKVISVQELLNSRSEWFTPGTILN